MLITQDLKKKIRNPERGGLEGGNGGDDVIRVDEPVGASPGKRW